MAFLPRCCLPSGSILQERHAVSVNHQPKQKNRAGQYMLVRPSVCAGSMRMSAGISSGCLVYTALDVWLFYVDFNALTGYNPLVTRFKAVIFQEKEAFL